MRQVTQDFVSLPRVIAKQILEHLERAGHNAMGKFHKVYPKPGTWAIEYDALPCRFGMLPAGVHRRSFSAKENERIEAASIKECTCGYSDAVAELKVVVR